MPFWPASLRGSRHTINILLLIMISRSLIYPDCPSFFLLFAGFIALSFVNYELFLQIFIELRYQICYYHYRENIFLSNTKESLY